MRPYSSAHPFFRDNSARRRIKAYSNFASLLKGWNVGVSKRKFGSRVRLMNINCVCHSVFCGRLEAGFPGWIILDTTRSGLGHTKLDKSRLFSCLTVHSRPPFPFTFCFLPPVNFGGAVGTVFRSVGFRDEYAAADHTAFQIFTPVNLRF